MSTPTKDTLGITLDGDETLLLPPSVILAGDPGVGKSTEAAKACQDGLFVQSSPKVLRPYDSWYRMCQGGDAEAQKKIVGMKSLAQLARKTIPETSELAAQKLTTWKVIVNLVTVFERAAKAGKNPYAGIVFDEWTDLASRVYEDMRASDEFKKNGKTNLYACIDAIKSFHRWILKLPERCGKYVVLVCHAKPPAYFDPDDETVAAEKRGGLKYKGGPAMPIGTLIEPVVAMSDFALHLAIEEDGALGSTGNKRFYLTEASPLYARKARDFRIPPRVEVDEYNLRDLLAKAGLTL